MPRPTLSHLECSKCGLRHDAFGRSSLCTACGKPLLARYDMDRARATLTRDRLASRRADLWRYREMLPVARDAEIVTLGEGWTPLIEAPSLGRRFQLHRVFVKDEGANPTASFKARGMSAAVSALVRLNIKKAYVPSAGNAAGALAAYGARAGIAVSIAMPRDTPEPNVLECRALGAEVHLLDGLIGDCGRFLRERFAGDPDAMDLSTLREPYRVEGKKTMLFELYEQFQFDLPEVLIYPTGGGTGIVGMAKAFDEMQQLGLQPGHLPRFVVVQASGCAPIVRAFEQGAASATAVEDAHTVASGLRVPSAIGDFLVLDALRRSRGTAVAVDDEELLLEMARASRDTGLFLSPEGAAAACAARRLAESGWIAAHERVVLFNTGSGLKYPEATRRACELASLSKQ
jgi:threonine synthase